MQPPTYEELAQRVIILEQNEAALLRIFAAAPIGLGLSSNRKFVRANDPLCLITGYSREELIGMTERSLYFDRKEYERVSREIMQQLQTNARGSVETRWRRKDGLGVEILLRCSPTDPTDSMDNLSVVVLDITEHRRAEAARQNSEAQFRSLFEFAPNPICLEEIKGGAIQANRAMCDLFGYSKKELAEKSFKDLMHPDDVYAWIQKRELILKGDLHSSQFEKRYLDKKGAIIWGITALSLLRKTDETPLFFTIQIQDITYIKRLEEQLLQAHKMKAIGTLAGGIAHDFNNLLMGIQGRVSLLLLDANQGEASYEHLKKIEAHIRRAANLTHQLLGFARGGNYELLLTDLSGLIRKEADMFARTRKDLTVRVTLSENLWPAKVDPAQIRQVLLNIYINASQAMPDGGTLTVKAENVQITPLDNKPLEIGPGKFIRISITDTGVGMDPGTKQRIFEPFFTTRNLGKGTGLGLASAYGIIRHHGGFINVCSEKGRGTTMSVYLPAEDLERPKERTPSTKTIKSRRGILLVDDEEIIIEIGEQMIRRLGYTVLTAASGQAAVNLYSENREIIDLVILDMIMPEMSGEETLNQLMGLDQNLKIIISSGYSINGKVSDLLKCGAIGFIQKPFNMTQLAEALHNAVPIAE